MQLFVFEITRTFPKNIRADTESLLASLPYAPIWQTVAWQLMLRESGYATKSFFLGVYADGKLLSYTLLEKRSIGLGQYGLFSLGGPVVADPTSLPTLSDGMRELAEKEWVVFVQIEPLADLEIPRFRRGSYKSFIEKHTALIDLTKSEEEILAAMKQKGRYNIRVAEKSDVSVSLVPPTDANIDTFYSLLTETTERDGFAGNSRAYYAALLAYLDREGIGGLAFAVREGEVIAAGIFTFSGTTALYYYGASSSDSAKRRYMASYLLQWGMIREAKRRGCQTYDFLGIADPSDTDSHLASVTDFKLKLTPDTHRWPDTQVMVVKWGWWTAVQTMRSIKGLFR